MPVPYYEDKLTVHQQYERPDSWDSDCSFHSLASMPDWDCSASDPDEYYTDTYTNLSSVRYNNPDDPILELTKPPNHMVTVNTTPYSHRVLAIVHQAWVDSLNTGKEIPHHLKHIPVPHGSGWCGRDFPASLYDGDPAASSCGYNPAMLPEDFRPCSNSCSGGWCSCIQKYSGRDFMS